MQTPPPIPEELKPLPKVWTIDVFDDLGFEFPEAKGYTLAFITDFARGFYMACRNDFETYAAQDDQTNGFQRGYSLAYKCRWFCKLHGYREDWLKEFRLLENGKVLKFISTTEAKQHARQEKRLFTPPANSDHNVSRNRAKSLPGAKVRTRYKSCPTYKN